MNTTMDNSEEILSVAISGSPENENKVLLVFVVTSLNLVQKENIEHQ